MVSVAITIRIATTRTGISISVFKRIEKARHMPGFFLFLVASGVEPDIQGREYDIEDNEACAIDEDSCEA